MAAESYDAIGWVRHQTELSADNFNHMEAGISRAFELAQEGGGGGSVGVELTQEEYDALPDTKYTDGVNYFIKNTTQTPFNVIEVTTAEYNSLSEAQKKAGQFLLTDDNGLGTASEISYEDVTVYDALTILTNTLGGVQFSLENTFKVSKLCSTTSTSNITLSDKISNYRFLIVSCFYNWNRGTSIIPITRLSDVIGTYQISYAYGTELKYGALQIVNDTTVKVADSTSTGTMILYGVMRRDT